MDPFQILGVSPRASWEEIRRAYLRKVKSLHPDRGGDREAYLALQEAYETLRRACERRRRVQVLRERPQGGEYLLSFVELTVREVALGTERWIRVPDTPGPCEYCEGLGLDPYGRFRVCEWCQGSGLLPEEGGRYHQLCPRCQGQGRIFLELCPRCRGKGEIRREKEFLIVIPPGVREGDLLFLPRSPEGPITDVFLEVFIKRDDRFYFEGQDLVCQVQVPFWKAALGGYIRVETLEGEEEIEIPRGLPGGSRLVIRQRGPFRPDGGRGDLILQFEIWFPEDYPPEALKLLERLNHIMEESYGRITSSRQ
ncbi:DnaJ C-terminal domain-containing protein [Thermosulfurimonas sp.]|uniref:DnaJ C-terminal domain-containing protein n=1 Tax=Thermosulfurimonas sp. TaxID=2080236 RepID=UPI0025CDF047|nr:DnaJ C-terminal domain-containing protein [Thermosulfurimonas sp.]